MVNGPVDVDQIMKGNPDKFSSFLATESKTEKRANSMLEINAMLHKHRCKVSTDLSAAADQKGNFWFQFRVISSIHMISSSLLLSFSRSFQMFFFAALFHPLLRLGEKSFPQIESIAAFSSEWCMKFHIINSSVFIDRIGTVSNYVDRAALTQAAKSVVSSLEEVEPHTRQH